MYANARKYGLTGTDAMVFEALVYLCRSTGEWKGSYTELARFSCCGNKVTAYNSVKRLIERGLAFKNETGAFNILTETFKIETKSKEERTKEENIKNNKSMHASLFESFWALYDSDKKWSRSKHRTRQLFEQLPEDWQRLAIEKAKDPPPDRDPYWYLKDEDFLRVGYGKKEAPAQPHWLTGEEQDECLKSGIILVVCRIPQTNRYGTVTKEDAEKFGLTILRQM